jgi:hypothetical protein
VSGCGVAEGDPPLGGGSPARCLRTVGARRGPLPPRGFPRARPARGTRRHAPQVTAPARAGEPSSTRRASCRRERSPSRALRPAASASHAMALRATLDGDLPRQELGTCREDEESSEATFGRATTSQVPGRRQVGLRDVPGVEPPWQVPGVPLGRRARHRRRTRQPPHHWAVCARQDTEGLTPGNRRYCAPTWLADFGHCAAWTSRGQLCRWSSAMSRIPKPPRWLSDTLSLVPAACPIPSTGAGTSGHSWRVDVALYLWSTSTRQAARKPDKDEVGGSSPPSPSFQ